MKNKILNCKIEYYRWLGNIIKIKEDNQEARKQIRKIKESIIYSMKHNRSYCYLNVDDFLLECWTNDIVVSKVKKYFINKGYKIDFTKAESNYYTIRWKED